MSVRPIDLVVVVSLVLLAHLPVDPKAVSWPGVGIWTAVTVTASLIMWGLWKHLEYFGIIYLARAVFVTVAIGEMVSSDSWKIPMMTLSAYLLIWAVACLFCAWRGTSSRILVWPFLPLEALRLVGVMFSQLPFSSPRFLRAVGGMLIFYGAMGAAWYFTRSSSLYSVVLTTFAGLGGACIFMAGFLLSFRIVKDYRTYLAMKNREGSLDTAEFLRQYHSFSTGSFKLRFLNLVRVRGLRCGLGDINTLHTLAREITNEVRFKPNTSPQILNPLIPLVMMIGNAGTTSYQSERRDEVYCLIENLIKIGSIPATVPVSGAPSGINIVGADAPATSQLGRVISSHRRPSDIVSDGSCRPDEQQGA